MQCFQCGRERPYPTTDGRCIACDWHRRPARASDDFLDQIDAERRRIQGQSLDVEEKEAALQELVDAERKWSEVTLAIDGLAWGDLPEDWQWVPATFGPLDARSEAELRRTRLELWTRLTVLRWGRTIRGRQGYAVEDMVSWDEDDDDDDQFPMDPMEIQEIAFGDDEELMHISKRPRYTPETEEFDQDSAVEALEYTPPDFDDESLSSDAEEDDEYE